MQRLLVAMLAACTSSEQRGDAGLNDAAPDGQADAAPDAAPFRCDGTKPFGTPVAVPGVNTADEETGAWMSSDQLRIYFARGTPGDAYSRDIFVATRPDATSAFGAAVRLGGVSSTAWEGRPSLTEDELTIVFDRAPIGNLPHLVIATRTSTAGMFGSLTDPTNINTGSYEALAWISADGLTLYFTTQRQGSLDTDIYRSTRFDTSAMFGVPLPVLEVNAPGTDAAPVLSKDGLELFFASNRNNTTGNNDVFRTTRVSVNSSWAPVALVTELSQPSNEGSWWLSADGCELMFSSDRSGGSGSYDLWLTSRR